jgi:hypothetical protein
MSSALGSIIASGSSPPWLPRDVAEGRRFAWWAEMMFLLWVLGWFIISIVALTLYAVGNSGVGVLLLGLIGLIAMIICFMSAVFMKKTVLDAIDQGKFHEAKNDSMIWILFGFAGFALPSILLILTYVKLGDAISSQTPVGYTPYSPGTVAVQQPPAHPHTAPPAPAPVQAPPQAAPPAHHQYHPATPMVRCKNCNVQFPTFMHTCPNCGAPKE